jgi:hypothetical protein
MGAQNADNPFIFAFERQKKSLFQYEPVLAFLSAGLLAYSVTFSSFVSKYYSFLPNYQSSLANLINSFSSPSDYLKAGILNFFRYAFAFILYPYSVILKTETSSKDDYLLGFSPLVKFLSHHDFAIAKGYSYGLIRYINEDVSVTSPLVHLVLVAAIFTFFFCLIFSSENIIFLRRLRQTLELKGISFIVLSLAVSAFTVFTFLAYHNWYVKYLGFIYICIIPTFSWILTFNCFEIKDKIITRTRNKNKHPLFLFLLTILAGISLFIFVFLLSFNWRFYSILESDQYHGSYKLYEEYLSSVGYTGQDSKQAFLNKFSVRPNMKTTLCFGEETPTLAPFLELLKNNVKPSTINFLPSDDVVCKTGRSRLHERVIVLP